MRPRTQIDRRWLNALFLALSQQFQCPIDVRYAAEDARVRTSVERAVPSRDQTQPSSRLRARACSSGAGRSHFCAKEASQQQIPLRLRVCIVAAYYYRRQPQLCGHCGRLPRLIRLGGGRVYQHVAALLYGLGDLVLKLADLVAAKSQAGQIVALDPNLRAS